MSESLDVGHEGHEDSDHALLRADLDRWNELPFVGIQRYDAGTRGEDVLIELRDCTCGSTLGRRITRRTQ